MKRQILAMMSCALATSAPLAYATEVQDSPALIRQQCLADAETAFRRDAGNCAGNRPDRIQACRMRVADTRTRSTLACEKRFQRTMERMETRAREQAARAQARARQ